MMSINLQSIELNNKGCEFFQHGNLDDSLAMFLGSMQVMLHSIKLSSPTSSSSSVHATNTRHINRALTRYNKKILEDSSSSSVVTEDKSLESSICAKALSIPSTIEGTDPDENRIKLYTAIVLYNTGLVHHLQGKTSDIISLERSIKIYEIACNIIADIDDIDNELTCQLILGLMNNMVHLYKDLGHIDLAHAYLGHLTDFVGSLTHHLQTSKIVSNNEPSNFEERSSEAMELLLNANISIYHPIHVAEAA